ncbi:Protein FAR-RED ELONGATED HYPOCOTYL [Arachis hypogaea]|nr:Protein FAR-RED ELONGATED HYPOCOTYL [Arachis hypogaea]
MHQRGEVKIQDISNFEDKPFSWVKLSGQNLHQAEMLKQHRELSMFVRRTIKTHEEARIRPNKTYQSFVAAAGSHRELGVNHHGQSTLLGCALTKNEDLQSFKWIFECWLHCMGGKAPKEEAFDINWIDFLRKYGLGGNKWLSELYEDRHIWIPIYLDHHFWAGMKSTQRSESMHSFFNKFITWNSSLRQFVKQYDNCLASREQAEREFDATDLHTVISCATKLAIKAQFQHVYTHEKFKEVQAQFRGKVNCITRLMHSTLGFTTYKVIEQVSNSTFNKFGVTYDATSRDVKCHCLLFESRGIFKNIKRRHTHIKNNQDEPLLELRSKRFDELVFWSHNICEFASESEELTGILHRAFDKVMAEMEEYQEISKGKSLLTYEEATLSNVNDLQSPPRVKTRGRPKNRLGSNLEKRSQMP